jgi:hypothetical protein
MNAGIDLAMAKRAAYRWICIVSGLLTSLLSMGGFTLAIRGEGPASAQQHLAGQAFTAAVLVQRNERRGPHVATHNDILPQPCELNEDGDEISDGSERPIAILLTRIDGRSCAASVWATYVGSLLHGAVAPLAPVRLQI